MRRRLRLRGLPLEEANVLLDSMGKPLRGTQASSRRFPGELDASRNRFGFTGHLWDRETNLLYAKARFYDPLVARFTTQDTLIGDVDSPPSFG